MHENSIVHLMEEGIKLNGLFKPFQQYFVYYSVYYQAPVERYSVSLNPQIILIHRINFHPASYF